MEGVVCTDWAITADQGEDIHSALGGKCWGVENLTVAERHLKALEAGVDQFGGNNDAGPVLEAYKMACEKYGEDQARKRFERSAVRLLTNIFQVGLFENPYLDLENLIYRPILLRFLPFVLGVACRLLDSLVDAAVVVLRRRCTGTAGFLTSLRREPCSLMRWGAFANGLERIANATVFQETQEKGGL